MPSSLSSHSISNSVEAFSKAASKSKWFSSSVPPTTITFSRLGRSSAGMRPTSSGVVTITFASLFSNLSLTAFSMKASNNGPTIAPTFKAPSREKYSSGERAMKMNTLSPFSTPASSFKIFAALLEASCISLNV